MTTRHAQSPLITERPTGTAAALCARTGRTPRQLAADRRSVEALQQTLLRDDCYLLGTKNQDPLDLARRAGITVSGELECHGGSKVLSGVTRQVAGESHQWAAPLGSDGQDGAWLQLAWPQAVTLSEVRLTFDTGFARPLTLTMSDHHTARTIRGPQPETVRDYALEALIAGRWQEIACQTGNYQRLCVHRFPVIVTTALRLRVDATNGDPHARVFEIRCN